MSLITKTVRVITALSFLVLLSTKLHAKVIYVDVNAAGTNSGINWTDAYVSLEEGLTEANSGDTIVVAKGVYVPHETDRSVYFNLKEGVNFPFTSSIHICFLT